jgi:hypothetical protein
VPNCESLLLTGKGGASVFCPLKSPGIEGFPAETTPCREARTYGKQARGVTPTSDVNDWMEVKDNTGSTVAAGVVTGARKESSG